MVSGMVEHFRSDTVKLMVYFINKSNDKGQIDIRFNQRSLSKSLKLDRRTIRQSIKELENYGAIKVYDHILKGINASFMVKVFYHHKKNHNSIDKQPLPKSLDLEAHFTVDRMVHGMYVNGTKAGH